MKSACEFDKLLPIVTLSIKARSQTYNKSIEFASYETPVVVQFGIEKKEFKVSDGKHIMKCRFSKDAVFLYKVTNHNKSLITLEGSYLILNQYSLYSYLDQDNNIKVHLNIHSFTSLNEEQAKRIKFSKKRALEIEEEPELKPLLEELRNSHLQEALNNQVEEMPELEEILAGRNNKKPEFITKVEIKSRREDKEDIIDFDKLNQIENAIAEDVDAVLRSQNNSLDSHDVETYTFSDKDFMILKKEELKDEAPTSLIQERVIEQELEETKGHKRRHPEGDRSEDKKLKKVAIEEKALDITKEKHELNSKPEEKLFK